MARGEARPDPARAEAILVDFHSHLMPEVDDGASTDEEASSGLEAMWAQGVRTIVATPHVDGSLTLRPGDIARRLEQIDAGWRRLQVQAAGERFPGLVLERGAEVKLDTPELDLSDERLRLAGGRFVLVEYPFMMVPPRSGHVLRTIIDSGLTPIVAHPERYAGVGATSRLPQVWKESGGMLQVNAGSLTGRYGPGPRATALALLQQGMVDFVCSDFHARGRPATAGARRVFAELEAAEHGDLLMLVNPGRMLRGEAPLPVPPVQLRRPLLDRLRRWLR